MDETVVQVEKFDAAGVDSALQTLNEHFDAVAQIIQECNDAITQTYVNISEGAIFGELGLHLQEIWDENGANFSDFHKNFEEWNKMVGIITANNLEFEASALEAFRTTSFKMDGVQEARQKIFFENSDKTTNYKGGSTYSYYDEKGNLIKTSYDKDNKIYQSSISEDDGNTSKISLYKYDEKGNYSVIGPDGKPQYYDKDGNTIDKPITFGADGRPLGQAALEEAIIDQAGEYLEDKDIRTLSIYSNEFKNLPPEVQDVIKKVKDLGVPNGSDDWKTAFDALPDDVKDIALSQYQGVVKTEVGNGYKITTTVPEGEYDGEHIVIPKEQSTDNVHVIIDSANKVVDSLNSRSQTLADMQTNLSNNAVFNGLDQGTRDQINDYLTRQQQAVSDASTKISGDIYYGGGSSDGVVGDAVSFFHWGSDTSAVSKAYECANSWKDDLSNIDSAATTEAYLNSFGIFL